MAGEGRLTPEEMDSALGDGTPVPSPEQSDGSADLTPLDSPVDIAPETAAPEELTAGDDRPSWSARAGGTVRAHKRLTAVTATCLLVLGALAVGYVETRPPPLDTRITASVWFEPNVSDMSGSTIQNQVVRSLLHLQVAPGGAALTATGFSAPGLGAGTVTQQGSEVTVSNPLDCNTIGDFAATAQPPVLHVTRTDAWGRTVSGTISVTDGGGTAGVPVADVSQIMRGVCVGVLGSSLQLVGARAATSAAGTVLVLTIHNPTRWAFGILSAAAGFAPPGTRLGVNDTLDPSSPLKPVAAGTTATVPLPVTRADCGAATSWKHRDGTGDFTLGFWAGGDGGFASQSKIAITRVQRAAIVTALAAPCVGAPQFLYVIKAGGPSSSGINFALQATASAGTVTIGYDPDYLQTTPPFFDVHAPGNGQRVTVTGQLAAGCSSPISQSSPELLRATVKVGAHSYPYQIWFNTKAVLEAEARMCGQVPDLATARSNGWQV